MGGQASIWAAFPIWSGTTINTDGGPEIKNCPLQVMLGGGQPSVTCEGGICGAAGSRGCLRGDLRAVELRRAARKLRGISRPMQLAPPCWQIKSRTTCRSRTAGLLRMHHVLLRE